jgi:hypothetical protein
LFYAKSKGISQDVYEPIFENIFSIPFEEKIDEAIQNENYRLAIRLYYLQCLKTLNDARLITYGMEKPNSNYLAQLKGTKLYTDFFKLTRDFDYVWYGQFNISKTLFQKMQQEYKVFKNNIAI